jgi:hypothetical protein
MTAITFPTTAGYWLLTTDHWQLATDRTGERFSQTLVSVETLHQCYIDITCISSITSKNTKGLLWFSQVI